MSTILLFGAVILLAAWLYRQARAHAASRDEEAIHAELDAMIASLDADMHRSTYLPRQPRSPKKPPPHVPADQAESPTPKRQVRRHEKPASPPRGEAPLTQAKPDAANTPDLTAKLLRSHGIAKKDQAAFLAYQARLTERFHQISNIQADPSAQPIASPPIGLSTKTSLWRVCTSLARARVMPVFLVIRPAVSIPTRLIDLFTFRRRTSPQPPSPVDQPFKRAA
jgi:hypothetical protein